MTLGLTAAEQAQPRLSLLPLITTGLPGNLMTGKTGVRGVKIMAIFTLMGSGMISQTITLA